MCVPTDVKRERERDQDDVAKSKDKKTSNVAENRQDLSIHLLTEQLTAKPDMMIFSKKNFTFYCVKCVWVHFTDSKVGKTPLYLNNLM